MKTANTGRTTYIKPEFDNRGIKIIGLRSTRSTYVGWAADIKETQGFAPSYPMIGKRVELYGMLAAAVSGDPTKRTAGNKQTVRLHHRAGQENQSDPRLTNETKAAS